MFRVVIAGSVLTDTGGGFVMDDYIMTKELHDVPSGEGWFGCRFSGDDQAVSPSGMGVLMTESVPCGRVVPGYFP
jgi:hypothetical protein